MGIVYSDGTGSTHQFDSGREMMRALGLYNKQEFIMTNEQGEVLGAGFGVEGLMGSRPILKALKNEELFKKSTPTPEQKAFFTKSAAKPNTTPNTTLEKVIEDLEILQKSMSNQRKQHLGLA